MNIQDFLFVSHETKHYPLMLCTVTPVNISLWIFRQQLASTSMMTKNKKYFCVVWARYRYHTNKTDKECHFSSCRTQNTSLPMKMAAYYLSRRRNGISFLVLLLHPDLKEFAGTNDHTHFPYESILPPMAVISVLFKTQRHQSFPQPDVLLRARLSSHLYRYILSSCPYKQRSIRTILDENQLPLNTREDTTWPKISSPPMCY